MRGYSDIWAMINKLAGELEAEELKRVICESVSDGRTNSLRELTGGELVKLRAELRKQTGFKPSKANPEKRRKRSAVLKLLKSYGIDTSDWEAVNRFVSQSRIAGKEFHQLNEEELEKLRRKMYAINRKKVKEEVTVVEPTPRKRKKRVYYTNVTTQQLINRGNYN